MEHLRHLGPRVALRPGIGHGQRALNGIRRQQGVAIRLGSLAQQLYPERVDGAGGNGSWLRRGHGVHERPLRAVAIVAQLSSFDPDRRRKRRVIQV